MKSTVFAVIFCSSLQLFSQPVIELDTFATDIPYGPLGLINCGDDRIFIICQEGYILISDSAGNVNPIPFLNIDSRVESDYNAHGLLGAVFHPDYATNGFFYVNYINNDMNSVIARFSVSVGDPDVADTLSEEILLTVDQPYTVHKAGDMHFGPDGYLYFPFGDGGVAIPGGPGDPDNRAQNPSTYLGKMLRIDVDGALPYEIPNTNPFYGSPDTLNEIWAIGLRNPWRFSFDRLTGDMWLSDVGHDLWEEIDFEPNGFEGGNNYGWRCYEGNAEYNFDSCDATVDYTFPIHVYPHDDSTGGYSVTGGYVYRGLDYPGLFGKYIYCDYVSGNFYTLESDGGGGWINTIYPDLLEAVVSFGEDKIGEMYCVVRSTGAVYKIKDKCAAFNASSIIADADCMLGNIGSIDLNVAGGTEPYEFEWSDGETTQNIDSLAPGNYSVLITDSVGCSISDTLNVDISGSFEVDYIVEGNMITVDSISGAEYVWYINDELQAEDTLNYLEIPTDMEMIVVCIITNTMGCSDTINLSFEGAVTDQLMQTILVHPNPARDILYFEIDQSEAVTIECTDLRGEVYYLDVVDANSIDVSYLPAGIYSALIIRDNAVAIARFEIVR